MQRHVISTNNIATGMIRARHKYAFNPPKIRFHPSTKSGQEEITVGEKDESRRRPRLFPKIDATAARWSTLPGFVGDAGDGELGGQWSAAVANQDRSAASRRPRKPPPRQKAPLKATGLRSAPQLTRGLRLNSPEVCALPGLRSVSSVSPKPTAEHDGRERRRIASRRLRKQPLTDREVRLSSTGKAASTLKEAAPGHEPVNLRHAPQLARGVFLPSVHSQILSSVPGLRRQTIVAIVPQ
jgi:hypothetical protein